MRVFSSALLKLRVDKGVLHLRKNISNDSVVSTSYGKLRGGIASSRGGRKFMYFAGIPYAEPPVATLRFKPPVPHKGWRGTRDALKEGNPAVQMSMYTKESTGEEDCLFVNVYTPQCDGAPKPVIVSIHGGAFGMWSGSASHYGAHLMMDQDIVLVTFNYRLGVLGFLNLDMEGASGNMGMKDQVLLLKWVKNEIHNFGGDPNNVTISGCSAGGASVHFHMISPLSKGLFHKAIAQSGSVPSGWAFTKLHRERSLRLGKYLDANTSNNRELLDHFMTVPAKRFVKYQNAVVSKEKHIQGNDWGFIPSLESVGDEKFLSSDPHQLVVGDKTADVPFLTGVNTHEGFMISSSSIMNHPYILESLNSDFKVLFQNIAFPSSLTEEEISALATRVRRKYFNDETIEFSKHFNEIVELYGNIMVKVPTLITLHHLRKERRQSPIFYYTFSVDTALGWYKKFLDTGGWKPKQRGVSHCDELGYLFSCSWNPQLVEHGSLADKTIARMTKMWANFAKTGDPSADVKWEPVFSPEHTKPMGLNIGKELVVEPVEEFNILSTFKELMKPEKEILV